MTHAERKRYHADYLRNRYQNDPEYRAKKLSQQKARYWRKKEADPEGTLRDGMAKVLWCKYGMSLKEYEDQSARQDHRCAICRQPETQLRLDKPMRLSVDHCHASGDVRGILCRACNSALALAKDSPLILRAMAVYLERGSNF